MITAQNPELIKRARLLRHHGMSVSDAARHGAAQVVFETYDETGFNFRMSDIHAAVGREQLVALPAVIKKRRAQAKRYLDALSDVPELVLPVEPGLVRTNWQSFCVKLPGYVNQTEFMQAMLDEGISTRRGIMCVHREKALEGRFRLSGSLKESEAAQDCGVLLPLYHDMTPREQDRVVGMVEKLCRK